MLKVCIMYVVICCNGTFPGYDTSTLKPDNEADCSTDISSTASQPVRKKSIGEGTFLREGGTGLANALHCGSDNESTVYWG
jgi:hypothetical protein